MKKKPNYFLKVIILLFLLFIFFYAMTKSGYYETTIKKRTILTEKKIREFENDINNNEVIDIDSYYSVPKEDYSSFASSIGKKTTLSLSKGLEVFFKNSGKVLKKLFW